MKSFCVLLCCCPALLAAGRQTLLPQPQRVQYGQGRLPLAGLSVAVAGTAAPEDTFAARTLSAGLLRRGGSTGGHTIRLIRTGAVDALPADNELTGADSRESYHVRI